MVYLVETFRSRHGDPVANLVELVRAAAMQRSVVLLGRFAVPADEIEFWLFDATSREDLTATLDAAEIGRNRVSQVEDDLFAAALDCTAWGTSRGLRPTPRPAASGGAKGE